MDNTLDPSVVMLAKSIRSVESNSNFDARGKSGEYGAYQFMPKTWKSWAGQYLGNPNAEMTPENQNKVAYMKIKDLKDQGYKPDQVASIWNSGNPNYAGNVGVNAQGVKFNTPQYVGSVMNKYQQFKNGNQMGATLPNPSQAIQPQQDQQLAGSVGGFVQKTLSNIFPSLGNLASSIGSAIFHPIDTLSNIASVVAGGAEKAVGMNTPDTEKFGNVASALGQRFGITKLFKGDVVGAGKDILTTVQNDPAGFALDLATVLEGGGTLAAKLGTEGSTLARAGEIAAKAGEAVDPLRAMGRTAGMVARPIVGAGENTVAKLVGSAYGVKPGQAINGVPLERVLAGEGKIALSDARLLAKTQADANVLKETIANKAATTAGNLNTAEVLGQTVKNILKKTPYSPTHIEDVILRQPELNDLLQKSTLTWQEANELRSKIDAVTPPNAFTTDANLSLQRRILKTTANTLRAAVQKATGTQSEFDRYEALIKGIKDLEKKRPQTFGGLKDIGIGGFGALAAGPAGALTSFATERALRSTLSKTMTAQSLRKILQGSKALANSKYAKLFAKNRIPIAQTARVSDLTKAGGSQQSK